MQRVILIVIVCALSGCASVLPVSKKPHFQPFVGRTWRTRTEAIILERHITIRMTDGLAYYGPSRPELRLRGNHHQMIHGLVPANTPVLVNWVRYVDYFGWWYYVAEVEISLPQLQYDRLYLIWNEDDEPILGFPGARRTGIQSRR